MTHKYMLKYLIIPLIVFLFSCHNIFQLKNGDLVFQDLDCGELCTAIENVTNGYNKANLSHVGIVKIENNKINIIEAYINGVSQTPLSTFLSRRLDQQGKPKVMVGRLKPEYQHLIEDALKYATKLKGKEYDSVFNIKNDKYYCSELIYTIFKKTYKKPFFELSPMTFGDNPVWKKYFNDLGVEIPENKPGINPGSISLSDNIDIVHYYGKISLKK